jgi:hypothetical protein
MAKLMVSIREENFRLLALEARERGITIQELLRAVIVPDWIRLGNGTKSHTETIQPRPVPMIRQENETVPILNRSRT